MPAEGEAENKGGVGGGSPGPGVVAVEWPAEAAGAIIVPLRSISDKPTKLIFSLCHACCR